MCIFAAVEEPSKLVVDTIIIEMPETIIAECLVVAEVEGAGVEMVGAGVEMVAEVVGETVEEAVAAVVGMEEVEVDVRKDSHMYEDKCNDVFKAYLSTSS